MVSERVIKKYANRRLYDAAESRHVTLDDLRKLIVQGEKIKVVDDKSGDDLTRSILLQIIADQEQFGQPILSTQTLESIIRFYGDAMQGFMGRYLEQSVASFVSQQQSMQSQLSRMVSGTPLASMTDFAQANLAMWQQMQENLVSAMKPRAGSGPGRPATGTPEPQAPGSEGAAESVLDEASDDAAHLPSGTTRRPRGTRAPRS